MYRTFPATAKGELKNKSLVLLSRHGHEVSLQFQETSIWCLLNWSLNELRLPSTKFCTILSIIKPISSCSYSSICPSVFTRFPVATFKKNILSLFINLEIKESHKFLFKIQAQTKQRIKKRESLALATFAQDIISHLHVNLGPTSKKRNGGGCF